MKKMTWTVRISTFHNVTWEQRVSSYLLGIFGREIEAGMFEWTHLEQEVGKKNRRAEKGMEGTDSEHLRSGAKHLVRVLMKALVEKSYPMPLWQRHPLASFAVT